MADKQNEVLVKACSSYDKDVLATVAKECLDHVDPTGELVGPNRKVLLKVNMLSAKPPEKAVTTHPALVRAVAAECVSRGATVLVGDSPAGPDKGIARYWEKTGIGDAVRETGAEMVNFESAGTFREEIDGLDVYITNAVRNADTIINIPKLKTHNLTMMTAAVKNLYGTLPGFQKGNLHALRPRVDDFCRLVVELQRKVAPAITIIDAVTAMEGNGPASGDPKEVGLVIAGRDAEAVDYIAARVMGFEPMDVPTIQSAADSGGVREEDVVATGDIENIDSHELVLPGNLRSARVQAWILRNMPAFVFRLLTKLLWLVPETTSDCVLCGKCVEGCPREAMSVCDDTVIVDRKSCVVCLRCQEICPHGAIRLKLSWLAWLLWG